VQGRFGVPGWQLSGRWPLRRRAVSGCRTAAARPARRASG
jgi:hypothetical protein